MILSLALEQTQGDSAGAGMAVALLLVLGIIAALKVASEGGGGGSSLCSGRAGRAMLRSQPSEEVATVESSSSRVSTQPVGAGRTVDFGTFPVARWLRDRAWSHDDGVYRGHFVAAGHRIRGEVHYRNNAFELLLLHPPRWARVGSHSACWRERGEWKLLHLNESPPNVVAAILGCEAFLMKKIEENAA